MGLWGGLWLTGASVKFLYLPQFLTKLENKTFLEYPSCPPTLGVRNPRGLDEAAVAGLLADMNARLDFLISRPELLFFKVVSMPGVRNIVDALSCSSSLRWQGNSLPRGMCLLSGESKVCVHDD